MTMKKIFLVPGLVAAVIALGACTENPGSETATPPPMPVTTPAEAPQDPAAADPTAADTASPAPAADPDDVMFAQMMIPHHEQAVVMSDIILAKPDLNPDIRSLAEQIKAAQQPEIETMTGWLNEWDAPLEPEGDHAGMEHDHGSMEGMLSDDEIEKLRTAETAEAQELFLSGMIEHHEGAVTMAEDVKANGSDPRVQELADEIISTQQAEISTMQGMLDSL